MKRLIDYFSPLERALWCGSVGLILLAYLLFDRSGILTVTASLLGVTSLIFCARGNPLGQVLMILFSLLYGAISWTFSYYGEMMTYLGMCLPMAVFSLVSWLRNPYEPGHSEVRVDHLRKGEPIFLWLLTLAVTTAFYFILAYFHTANLIPSTISVTTSFLAAYLTFRRNPLYALAYAANDLILILLWVLAAGTDSRYWSVVVCFAAFLANDLYAFFNWRAMERRQAAGKRIDTSGLRE